MSSIKRVKIEQRAGHLPFRIERISDGLDIAGFPTQIAAGVALQALKKTTVSGRSALVTLIQEAEQEDE